MADVYDVVVIGAGIAGISVARHLAQQLSVAVLEAESQVLVHSTGRSAALFTEIYGNLPVRLLSRGSRQQFFDPPADFCETPLVKRRGALWVARADQLAQLEALARQPDVAAGTLRITAAQVERRFPLLRPGYAAAGLYEEGACDVDVNALYQAYLRQMRALGGRLFTDAAVTGLERRDGAWSLETRGGSFRASLVVNAAGAWADQVAAMAGVPPIGLTPCRRTALLVEAPGEVDMDACPMVIDIDEQFYMKPDAGLLLLSPADETPSEPCDAQPEELDVAITIDRVERATTLQVRRVRAKWAGLRCFVADRTPVAGYDEAAEGFFWLAGQGGYGIQTAPALSRLAAALIQGQEVPDDLRALGLEAADLAPGRLGAR